MRNLTKANIPEAVIGQLDNLDNLDNSDPRLKEIVTALVRHLLAFAAEVNLTEEEWLRAIQFANTVGQRDEMMLLSDVLGLSILVDSLNHRQPEGTTESSVLGPFYRPGAAVLESPANLAAHNEGAPVIFSGCVTSTDHHPLPEAQLDIWQTHPNGRYENQDQGQPEMNLRGVVKTDAEGRYAFLTVKPVSYGITFKGPVSGFIQALGRHPYRPAHIHFKVTAPGHAPITTMVFVEGDPYLDSDPVFGVKSSLITEFHQQDEPTTFAGCDLPAAHYTATYDFRLHPLAD